MQLPDSVAQLAEEIGEAAAVNFCRRALNALNRNEKDYSDVRRSGAWDRKCSEAYAAFSAKRGGGGDAIIARALDALASSDTAQELEGKAT